MQTIVSKTNVTALILAGGLGTRMGDLCTYKSKPLLPFNKIPFIQYIVSKYIANEIPEILIITNRENVLMIDTFSTRFWKNNGVKIIVEETRNGTGGAIKIGAQNSSNNILLVSNADTVVDFHLKGFLKQHMSLKAPITSLVTTNGQAPNKGSITIENDIVVDFNETGLEHELYKKDNLYNASSTGAYLMNKKVVLSKFPDKKSSLEKEILPKLVNERKVFAFSNEEGYFKEWGKKQDYLDYKKNERELFSIYRKVYMDNNISMETFKFTPNSSSQV